MFIQDRDKPVGISTTSASGSSNALKSDWSPLYNREVTLIPDADEPGIKYAKTVAAELLVNGSDVYIIDTLALGWSEGDDVADYSDLNQDWLLKHWQQAALALRCKRHHRRLPILPCKSSLVFNDDSSRLFV